MKYTIAAAIITTALATTANAQDAKTYPQGFFFKPSVGLDYQYTDIDFKGNTGSIVDDSLHGLNVHAGARVHKNLGFELGYTQTEKGDKSTAIGDTELKLRSVSLDALAYLPVTADGRFELIGTAGVAYTRSDLDTPVGNGDDKETKFRAGAGAQYWLSDSTNIRALVRYQDADFDGTANHALLGNVGLNYEF